ncbi:MAG: glycosyltransferase family 39 protein [Chloroflexota bacterium]
MVGIVLAVVGAGSAAAALHSGALTWDESVYASQARSLVTDVPSAGFEIYRPPGLPLIGLLTAPFGFGDASLRLTAVGLGLLSLLLLWALARSIYGPTAALVALVGIVGSPVLLAELRMFHNDLPSVALLLLLMLLLWHEFEVRPEPSRLVLTAGVIAAAAFYLRYGTAPAIAGIAIAALLVWPGKVRHHPRLMGATIAIGIALLLPHLVESMVRLGSPLGIITSAADQVNTTGPIVSTWQYLRWLPRQIAGTATVLIIAAAIAIVAAVIHSVRERRLAPGSRQLIWLMVAATIASVGTVLVSHAERRYVLFPLGLVAIAGSASVVAWLRALLAGAVPTRRRLAIAGLVVALVVQVGAVGYLERREIIRADRHTAGYRWAIEVGQAIAADAHGPCQVWTTLRPIVGWNSGCATPAFGPDPANLIQSARAGARTYLVFTDIDHRRSPQDVIDRYRAIPALSTVVRIPAADGHPGVKVDRLGP